jgi:dTDP-4-dehydrorhamnose reductase
MRILVTGSSGLLGVQLVRLGLEDGHQVVSGYNVHEPSGGEPIRLDLAELHSLVPAILRLAPNMIIHTGSITDVDQCEQKPEFAELVNGEATGKIAEAAFALQAYLVYVSTDYVFDGKKGRYAENDTPNPINAYGESKLLGEQLLRKTNPRNCIVRSSVVYGWGRAYRPNFATWVLTNLRSGKMTRVVRDQYASPTLNLNLAEMIWDLSKKRLEGIFHLAGATRINRCDFARSIAEVFHLDPKLIEEVSSKEIDWKAKRPADSSLAVSKASRLLDRKPLKLQPSLELFRGEQAK